MEALPYNEIRHEYDDESKCYYIIWQPLIVIGIGGSEKETLEDLRVAAHFGIETMVNSKMSMADSYLSFKV